MTSILIVDDEKDIVDALKIYLSNSDYRLYEAYTGKDAIEIVRNNEIDLILMDIMMPVMDGIKATHELRKITNVPIIFLTACDDEIHTVLALEQGADDYIAKPFRIRELIARIKGKVTVKKIHTAWRQGCQ